MSNTSGCCPGVRRMIVSVASRATSSSMMTRDARAFDTDDANVAARIAAPNRHPAES